MVVITTDHTTSKLLATVLYSVVYSKCCHCQKPCITNLKIQSCMDHWSVLVLAIVCHNGRQLFLYKFFLPPSSSAACPCATSSPVPVEGSAESIMSLSLCVGVPSSPCSCTNDSCQVLLTHVHATPIVFQTLKICLPPFVGDSVSWTATVKYSMPASIDGDDVSCTVTVKYSMLAVLASICW